MTSTAIVDSPGTGCPGEASPSERLEELLEKLAELTGQRNAIDGRIVEVVAEIDRDELWGATGARSVAALVAWKTGSSTANANAIANIAHRRDSFPRCTEGMREGLLSLDQVGVIASRAADGSDQQAAQPSRRGAARHHQTGRATALQWVAEGAPRCIRRRSNRRCTRTWQRQCGRAWASWRLRRPSSPPAPRCRCWGTRGRQPRSRRRRACTSQQLCLSRCRRWYRASAPWCFGSRSGRCTG